mmetsp:Transcript_30181/g.70204  ORF Transcript_30181/g.70204 Transcript_30181/m.70204 type:complete len:261 (+) Transcript_30181:52-834(+)
MQGHGGEPLCHDVHTSRSHPALFDGSPLKARMQWYVPPRRPYSRRELLADRCVNFAGAGLAWLGAGALSTASWMAGDPALKQLGFLAHGLGLVSMLNCSAVYHYGCWDWSQAARLYALDHIGISSMIMGCYAPVMLHCRAFRVLAFVWALGGLGLLTEVRKLVAGGAGAAGKWTLSDWLNLVRYLLMGWALLPVLPATMHSFSAPALRTMLAGGLLYTGGLGFLLVSPMEFHLAVWHSAVLAASCCFYSVNLLELVGPGH